MLVKKGSLVAQTCAPAITVAPHAAHLSCLLLFPASRHPRPSSDVPHFQTISRSWLSCLGKFLVTMRWVGNTHRNTSPGEVRHPCVSGSLWETVLEAQGSRRHVLLKLSDGQKHFFVNVWCSESEWAWLISTQTWWACCRSDLWAPPTPPERAPDWDFV